MEVVLDIETISNLKKSQVQYALDCYQHNKGKFKTKKEKQEFLKQLETNAPLKPQTAKIVSIAWLTNGDKEFAESSKNEEKVLRAFTLWMNQNNYQVKRWVSFNGKKFDWPTITIRAMVRDIMLTPAWVQLTYPFENKRHCDLFHLLGSSLAWNLTAFGLPPKVEIGFDVQALYDQKKLKRIKNYCLADCKSTRDLYLKVKGIL